MAASRTTEIPRASIEATGEPFDPIAVLNELDRILESRHFRSSKQGKRFLRYIVEQTLEGNAGFLKERLLGAALFDRAPDYSTGEDSVVRVQANEVRRRLDAYRAEDSAQSSILIELPVGTYAPVFRKNHRQGANAEPVETISVPSGFCREEKSDELPGASGDSDDRESTDQSPTHPLVAAPPKGRWLWRWIIVTVSAGLCCAAIAAIYVWRTRTVASSSPDRLTQAFWAPVLSSPNPVVICLGKTVVYRPSDALFDKYIKSHPASALVTDNDRLTRAFPFNPNDTLKWGDLIQTNYYGFTVGTVRSSTELASYFAQQHKAFDIRVGSESSFAELRNSPAVLVGAFNNRWTMELTSGLHFAFTEGPGPAINSTQLMIREKAPSNRSWTWQRIDRGAVRDYGVITRQIDVNTGQSLVSVAGISDGGTEAATEMVTKPEELAPILQSLPSGWEKKNIQILISTEVRDGEAGRPALVAYYLW